MTEQPDEIEVPEDAGEYADALAAILRRIPKRWGRLSVDRGWYPILARLDAQLAALDPDYEVHQVKEKFGGLRYYAHTEVEDEAAHEQFRHLVLLAEGEAGRTCERCGRPGRAHICRTNLRTLCPSCADAMSDEKGRYEPVQHPAGDSD